MSYVRSILFNVLFYALWTPLVCVLGLPALLMSRTAAVKVATFYQWGFYYIAKYSLGLDFEVRGIENKPADGTPYLVAAKHYSAYETLILFCLFKDPAIILKKELLMIPLFGWYLKKLEVIALNRSKKSESLQSLYDGANRIKNQNRPIVIFPQGTRIRLHETTTEKPYKGGLAKLYTALDLPVLPVALNSGLYWPRNSFLKKPGTVVIELLPPIPPGLPAQEMMTLVENAIEVTSGNLITPGLQQTNLY